MTSDQPSPDGRQGDSLSRGAFVRRSRLPRATERDEVAAVCYRLNGHGIEFLLVRTRRRRWTFPKGGVEPSLTHAQAAALEAYEEAGVHGRIEQIAFVSYTRYKRSAASGAVTLSINAFLCEVQRQEHPQESNRNPTWFSPEKTKRRLAEDRSPRDAAEFSQVIDRAVARIQRLLLAENSAPDALQQVQFEAPPPATTRIQQVTLARYIRAASPAADSALEFTLGRVSKLLDAGSPPAPLTPRSDSRQDPIPPKKGQLIELSRRKRH